MAGVEHRTVGVNGINLHIAEKGDGPEILFLHGFPELWYSWRHQILGLSSLGYRCIAPDLRGFGDSDAPDSVSSYSCFHIVGDLIALLDFLGIEKVFLVAQDWGAAIAWYLCLFRPDRVKAFVCLSVPFRPRNPKMKPVQTMRAVFGDNYYMCRFQKPGEIEVEFAEAGTKQVLKNIMTTRKPGPPSLPKGDAFKGLHKTPPIELPSWLSEEDLDYFAAKYDQRGFTGGLNYYRAIDLNWELTAAWTGAKVNVAVKFVVGELDMIYTTPGAKEYVQGGGFKRDVPLLEEIVVIEGVGHFINQEKAEEINNHIFEFFNKF